MTAKARNMVRNVMVFPPNLPVNRHRYCEAQTIGRIGSGCQSHGAASGGNGRARLAAFALRRAGSTKGYCFLSTGRHVSRCESRARSAAAGIKIRRDFRSRRVLLRIVYWRWRERHLPSCTKRISPFTRSGTTTIRPLSFGNRAEIGRPFEVVRQLFDAHRFVPLEHRSGHPVGRQHVAVSHSDRARRACRYCPRSASAPCRARSRRCRAAYPFPSKPTA